MASLRERHRIRLRRQVVGRSLRASNWADRNCDDVPRFRHSAGKHDQLLCDSKARPHERGRNRNDDDHGTIHSYTPYDEPPYRNDHLSDHFCDAWDYLPYCYGGAHFAERLDTGNDFQPGQFDYEWRKYTRSMDSWLALCPARRIFFNRYLLGDLSCTLARDIPLRRRPWEKGGAIRRGTSIRILN